MNHQPMYYYGNPFLTYPPHINPDPFSDKINYLIKENESIKMLIDNMNKNIDSLIDLNKVLLKKINNIDNKFKKESKKDKMVSMNNLINKKNDIGNLLNDIMKDNEGSIIIQMETDNPINKSMNDNRSLFNPFKFLNSIFGDKPNEKEKENENIKEEDDNISECGSDIEIEELGIDIKSIDDLIKIGSSFDKIKEESSNKESNKETSIKNEDKENIKMELVKFGISSDVITKMLNDDEILMEKKYKINNQTNESNKKTIINKGLYEINGKKYSINLETLNKLVNPLTKLKNTIGMDKVKSGIFDMILYYLQNFETKNNNMLHTIIEGPPGVGKTMVGRIIGEIYAALGIIPSNKFKLVKRTDLIGEYVGHTAHKTQKAIDEANGGILFIDEAYSLGSDEKKDTFSKECIDTINQNLSENKKKFICIIAGYPQELENCFFSYNLGLKRRFPFKYTIDGYTSTEMYNIFIKMINDIKWKLNNNVNYNEIMNICKENSKIIKKIGPNNLTENLKIIKQIFYIEDNILNDNMMDNNMMKYMNDNKDKFNFENDTLKDISNKLVNILNDSEFGFPIELFYRKIITNFFEEHKKELPNYGGDLENLLVMCKFSHSKRIIGKHPKLKRKLILEDIKNGFNKFVENKKKENDDWKKIYL